ncbi:MAG: FAD-dependent oxidoreductase [Planctomycetia bacterium]|nr:FAD-dependent oxidoreductase [Planctomycetia bacterium]
MNRWIVAFIFLWGTGVSWGASYDVVIYGGTSAAVTAAVQVKKMGRSVVVVSPDKHLGGLTSSGLGYTDSGNTASIGGLTREFYRRIYREYQKPEAWTWQKMADFKNQGQGTRAMRHDDRTMWTFEPHVAEAVFEAWVREYEIPVVRGAFLDRENGVVKQGGRIVSITTCAGQTFAGRVFLDCTYEGDLLAAAGVSYRVGREASAEYGEVWNGNQVGILHHGHWFSKPVSAYRVPGDPKSGRVKYVDDSAPGLRGEGDHRVQAYCYRLCMTDVPENRIPFAKPENYNPDDYELLRRVLATGWNEVFAKFDRIPNGKTDTNNHGPFSMDFIGENYAYPEASYAERKKIVKAHENYQRGLLYFLANDPSVPAEIRAKMSRWGLAKDEFPETAGWPHQIYVREARRMVGVHVMTEEDCLGGGRRTLGPVGMGSYTMDSHNVRRYVTPDGTVQNEGDIGISPKQPYRIDLGAILPKREECDNLLVPVCMSSSHIAYGSIRMEPVFMILGQSAATAACLAVEQNVAVQEVDYPSLSRRLLADGQILSLKY